MLLTNAFMVQAEYQDEQALINRFIYQLVNI